MLKKLTLPILIIVIIVQLLVPVSMVVYGNSAQTEVEKYGTQYVLDINIASIQKGKVIFSPVQYDLWYPLYEDKYVLLGTYEDGKAYGESVSDEKPEDGDYLKPTQRNANRLDEYPVDYDGEILSSRYHDLYTKDAYIKVKVYEGNLAVTGLYIEDIPIEEWVVMYDNNSLPVKDDIIDFNEELIEDENLFENT